MSTTQSWLALVIGNTRLHWGYFCQNKLESTWHTLHMSRVDVSRLITTGFATESWQQIANHHTAIAEHLPRSGLSVVELWVGSVVPQQTALWRQPAINPQPSILTEQVVRSRIPINHLYPTLGIDRAITLLGAGSTYGWPVVVIDAGTALTLTAGIATMPDSAEDSHSAAYSATFYGGAILPGLRLQTAALSQGTAMLSQFADDFVRQASSAPEVMPEMSVLPERWALDSSGAIASGITYGLTATLVDYLSDWWERHPEGKALMTGGDAHFLHQHLMQRTPEIGSRVHINQDLMFYGMRAYRSSCQA
ncbi:MAG: type III pantothenate kinase [Cyanobacteria bacterium J06632_3]